MENRISLLVFSLTLILIIITGCSGKSNPPLVPDITRDQDIHDSSRMLIGLWDVEVIPDSRGSADIIFIPVRSPQVHLNILGIIQNNLPGLTLEQPISLVDNILEFTLRYHHPLPMLKYTVFDMRGIFIGHGTKTGFSEGLVYAGETDFQVLNADGHTRLWNPAEYSGMGYIDGKLLPPHSEANYTATLNGYKYFTTSLDPDQDVTTMDIATRGAFPADFSAARHFVLKLSDTGLPFQYAVDANWWFPTEPVEVPGSFDVERANCPEPYHMDVTIGPGISAVSGSAGVQVDIYDWQNDVENVYLEAPEMIFDTLVLSDPVDMDGFLRFNGILNNDLLPHGDSADILIYAEGTDPESLKTYRDYRLYSLPLFRLPPGGVIITLQDDMAYKKIGVEYEYGGTDYDIPAGNFPPVDQADLDGPWDFTAVPNDASSIRSAIAKTDPEVAGFAGNFTGYVNHFFKTQLALGDTPEEIYQAEEHWEGGNVLRLWGFYYDGTAIPDGISPAFPLDPPIDFQYPIDIHTHYVVYEEYIIGPSFPVILLTLKIRFEIWGLGEGITFAPEEPGIYGWGWNAQPSLLVRTFASLETGGLLGQGPMGDALMYEFIADDGTVYGIMMAGNSPTGDPNFSETTFEILGGVNVATLRSVTE
ncbi:hypothetical protein KAU08_08175 [bacterium]|nr:hypothetical protein [bacterium]